jgi:RpiB/LacA/LacB family sugar-phosphate isomerase
VEYGAQSTEAYDYPDAVDPVACDLLKGNANFGVIVCGSGIGVDIRANRFDHIRAANCVTEEMAELSRQHNHANVLCLGARLMDSDRAKAILKTFLATAESQEPRHVRRVEKMDGDVTNC